MAKKVSIDTAVLQEHLNVGVRRSAVFLGLGVNAARDPEFKTFGLTKITEIQIVPATRDAKTITAYKESFEQWVVGNGLRELVETFAIFLDMIYRCCCLVSRPQLDRNFENQGVQTKPGPDPRFETLGVHPFR